MIGSGIGWVVMVSFFVWLLTTKRPAGKQVALMTVWACGFLLVTIVGLQILTSGHQKSTTATKLIRPESERHGHSIVRPSRNAEERTIRLG